MKTHTHPSSKVVGNALRIRIPSLKKWGIIIPLAGVVALYSVCSFALIPVAASESLVGWEGRALQVTLILWIILMALQVIVIAYLVLWQLFGQEEIEVAPDSIAIRQAILGIGRREVYPCEQINRMRTDIAGSVEPFLENGEGGLASQEGTGVIAFDYKGKTIRWGIAVALAEAEDLVAEIQRQYPQYKK